VSVAGFMIRQVILACAALALAVSLLAGLAAYGQFESRSIRDGVFSATQIERGRRWFRAVCMECHEMEEFTGAGAYLEEMDGKTLWEVFEYVWLEMPEDDPGSLAPERYADVLSYIFSVYGMPAGDADMSIDQAALEQIVIKRPSLPGS
jgi:mono/diheme cytochrome c family protein